jgi:hypothetical protein
MEEDKKERKRAKYKETIRQRGNANPLDPDRCGHQRWLSLCNSAAGQLPTEPRT